MVKTEPNTLNREKSIAKGALVNVLGTIGKVLFPLFFILVTRLYGPEIMGIYFLIYKILDITVSLTVSGINDGMLMFLSRDIDNHKANENKIYMIISNGVVISLVITLLLIIIGYSGGFELLQQKYPQPEVVKSVQYMIWVLPFVFIPIIIIAATKSLMIMKYEALMFGFIRPLLFSLFAVIFYFIEASLESLLIGYYLTSIIMSVCALIIFHKYFSFKKLLYKIIHFKVFKPLISFAIPQNINITFSTFITNLDVLMLGYFQFSPEMIGFYGMGAQITRNLREVKLAFSGSYAPIIARLHAEKNYEKMNYTFSMVSRWTSTIGFPIAVLIATFRTELIQIFDPSYIYDNTFMLLLLIPPLVSCTIGLSANILVMTGHSGWNLFNSIFSIIINGTMNYMLIPKYGLTGAAAATVASSILTTTSIMFQIYFMEKVKLVPSKIYKAYITFLTAGTIFAILTIVNGSSSALLKTLNATTFISIYILMLLLLKIEPEDKELFFKNKIFQNKFFNKELR